MWPRHTATPATACAPKQIAPFMTSAAGVPHRPPTPPVSPLPIGDEPTKTVVYTLITRPRSGPGTVICTSELALAVVAIAAAPQTRTAASAIGNAVVLAST